MNFSPREVMQSLMDGNVIAYHPEGQPRYLCRMNDDGQLEYCVPEYSGRWGTMGGYSAMTSKFLHQCYELMVDVDEELKPYRGADDEKSSSVMV